MDFSLGALVPRLIPPAEIAPFEPVNRFNRVNRVLISPAIVMNASSTFTLALALVSKNGIPNSSANACPRAFVIARFSSDTSHLFPIKILFTLELACCSIFRIHPRTFSKLFSSDTSYTSKIPIAPR